MLNRCLGLMAMLWAVPVATLAAQNAGPSFLIFRYASQSSLGMYSGYTAGPVLMVVGLLHNPRTEYQEVMAGVGHPISMRGGNSIVVLPAIAYTNTGWYSQLYFVPTIHAGALTVSGTLQFGQPLSDRGSQSVNISPGNVLLSLGGGFAVGAGYYGGAEAGSLPSHGAGPAIQKAVPRGSITAEFVKGITSAKDEVRLTLRSSF